jgi:hypothetical protein
LTLSFRRGAPSFRRLEARPPILCDGRRGALDAFSGKTRFGGSSMLDIVFVAVTLAFFLLSWLYVRACERV